MKNKITKSQVEHGLKSKQITPSVPNGMTIDQMVKQMANNNGAITATTADQSAPTNRSARSPGTRTLSHRERKMRAFLIKAILVIATIIAVAIVFAS